jgi:trans-aconitate methyltransferase
MDPLGKKELLSFYDRHLKHFGDSPQAVRWTEEGQRRRYEVLLRISEDLAGKRVLDFGCGKGDLYGFMKERGIQLYYCGVDINENLISVAKSKYPDAEFISMDLEETKIGRTFDVIFSCGVFNLRVAGVEDSMKDVLRKLFQLCTRAVHVNLLTYYVPQRSVELYYVKPEEILHFAVTELSKSVTLRHTGEDVFLSLYKG